MWARPRRLRRLRLLPASRPRRHARRYLHARRVLMSHGAQRFVRYRRLRTLPPALAFRARKRTCIRGPGCLRRTSTLASTHPPLPFDRFGILPYRRRTEGVEQSLRRPQVPTHQPRRRVHPQVGRWSFIILGGPSPGPRSLIFVNPRRSRRMRTPSLTFRTALLDLPKPDGFGQRTSMHLYAGLV